MQTGMQSCDLNLWPIEGMGAPDLTAYQWYGGMLEMFRRRRRSLPCLMVESQARHCACLKWGLQRYIVTLATDYWLGLDERRLFWNAAAHACFMLRVSRIQEVHCLYIIDCTISFSLSTS